jgi:hypothetical protein
VTDFAFYSQLGLLCGFAKISSLPGLCRFSAILVLTFILCDSFCLKITGLEIFRFGIGTWLWVFQFWRISNQARFIHPICFFSFPLSLQRYV